MSANRFQESLDKIIDCRQSSYQGYFNENDTDLLQELVDKEIKMSKLHEEIYNAYHHGTKEECDKQVSELIYQIEYDWVDSDE